EGPTVQTHDINNRFTEHFRSHGHTVVPSASLILDDPTLLFVNAGMVQFKPYFLGEAPAPYPRASSIQKCVRTGDIDEVGKTTRRITFGHVVGDLSDSDDLEEEAMDGACELLAKAPSVGGYACVPQRLWVTDYEEDDEARALWQRVGGDPAERIQARDGKDN